MNVYQKYKYQEPASTYIGNGSFRTSWIWKREKRKLGTIKLIQKSDEYWLEIEESDDETKKMHKLSEKPVSLDTLYERAKLIAKDNTYFREHNLEDFFSGEKDQVNVNFPITFMNPRAGIQDNFTYLEAQVKGVGKESSVWRSARKYLNEMSTVEFWTHSLYPQVSPAIFTGDVIKSFQQKADDENQRNIMRE